MWAVRKKGFKNHYRFSAGNTRKIDLPLIEMEQIAGEAWLGEISSLVGHIAYLSEDVKDAAG